MKRSIIEAANLNNDFTVVDANSSSSPLTFLPSDHLQLYLIHVSVTYIKSVPALRIGFTGAGDGGYALKDQVNAKLLSDFEVTLKWLKESDA